MRYFVFALVLFYAVFAPSFSFAQEKDSNSILTAKHDTNRRMIQFSGAVVTADSLKPVRFANILVQGQNRGSAANYNGFFSFVAFTGDVIEFSAQGYKKSYFTIPDTLKDDHYSMFQMMQTDTIMLQETVIYPWATVEALEYAIVHTDIPETDYDRAMKNLRREALKEIGLNMAMDGSMNYRNEIQGVIDRSYYAGQYTPYTFLNPFAWMEFFKAWKEGKFKKKK